MKRWLCLLLICLLPWAAMAEDVCFVRDVTGGGVTTGCSYLRLQVPVEGDAQVTLTIAGPGGNTVYQRDFGVRSEPFRTEDIYLKLKGNQTTYQVTLQVGDAVYDFPVERVVGRLTGSAACTVGYPLSEISGVDGWRSATLLRVRDGSVTVPVHAAGAYEIGSATFRISGGKLTVSVELDGAVNGEVDSAKVYVATNALAAGQLGKSKFNGYIGRLNKAIDLSGAEYAAVYVKLTVSFDPGGATGSPAVTLDGQGDLWEKILTETANEAIG